MNIRKIYASQDKVLPIINKMELIESDVEFTAYKLENEIWHYYETSSMYFGNGIPILYKTPKPSVSELIKLTMESQYNDEAYGACLILRDNELNKQIDFRQDLIKILNSINIKKQGIEEKTRIQNIILFTELDNPENRRPIIGKTSSEIEKDSEYFSAISGQAFEIIEKLKPTFFEKLKMRLKKK